MPDSGAVVHQFIARINHHDPADLVELMADDHRLIDAAGAVVTGREALRQAWAAYFAMVPDYWIRVEELLARLDIVAVFGSAGGTWAPDGDFAPERRWQVPAAWRVVVRDQQVAEWQVYADNEPLRRLMQGSGPS